MSVEIGDRFAHDGGFELHPHPPAPFDRWTDEQVQSLARLIDSAAGEGEMCFEIADALRKAAESREINLPLAYGHGEASPELWRKGLDR